jgi:ABC-2 type transport system permease protein
MMAYLSVSLKSFSRNMAYRSEVWFRILGNVVLVCIQVSIWKALIGTSSVSGLKFQDMVTYSIINTAIHSMLMTGVFRTVDQKLSSGNISTDLLKPIRYPFLLFFEQLGNTLFQLIFTVVPTVAITMLFFEFAPLSSREYFIPFCLTLVISIAISFALGYLIALIAFWFLTTFALEWMLYALITVFSGSFVPLWFFSPGWKVVANLLPFQYLGFIPAAMYMGKIPLEEVNWIVFKGLIWVVLLLLVTSLLWWRAMRRLIIQGG